MMLGAEILKVLKALPRRKEQGSCDSFGRHSVSPESWRCERCGVAIAIMASPKLPC
jgi:hypothetical protein